MPITATTFFDTSDDQAVLRIDVGNPNSNLITQTVSPQRDAFHCLRPDQGELVLQFPSPSVCTVGHCKWWRRSNFVHILFWGENSSSSSADNVSHYYPTVASQEQCRPRKATVCFPDNIHTASLSIAPNLNKNHNIVTVVVTAATQLTEILCARIDVSIPRHHSHQQHQRLCQVSISAPYNIITTLPQEKIAEKFRGSCVTSMCVIENPAIACTNLFEEATESDGSVPLVVCAITNGFSVWVVHVFENGETTAVPSLSLGNPPPLLQSHLVNSNSDPSDCNRYNQQTNWSTITLNSTQPEKIDLEDGSENEEDHTITGAGTVFNLLPVVPFRKRLIQSLITVTEGLAPIFGILQSDGTIVMIHTTDPLIMVFQVNVPVKGTFDTPFTSTCRVVKDKYLFAVAGSKQRVAFISCDISTKESKVHAIVAQPPGKSVSICGISICLADDEEIGNSQISALNYQLRRSQCTIVWSGCELWTSPVTPLTVMAGGATRNADQKEGGCSKSCTMVGIYSFTQRTPIHQFIWSGGNVSSQPFITHFGGLGPHKNATIVCDVNPTKGTTTATFIDLNGEYSSEPLSMCSSAVLGNVEPSDGYTYCGIPGCGVLPTSVVAFGGVATPILLDQDNQRWNLLFSSNNDIPPEHLAFAEGLRLFSQIDKGPFHLHYLFNRTVISASRFISLAEYLDLGCSLSDACVTSQWTVSEVDMTAAIEWVMSCESMKDVPFCLTSRFISQASLQDLSARLIFIILAYAAWVCGPNSAECTSSPLIPKVCDAVESIVASIRIISGLAEDVIRLASPLLKEQISFNINDNTVSSNNDDTLQQPRGVITRVVMPLIKDYGSLTNILSVAAGLSDMKGVSSLRALNEWVTVNRVRNPLVCHFNIESIIKSCRTNGASSAIVLSDSVAAAMQLSQLPTVELPEVFDLIGSFRLRKSDLAVLNLGAQSSLEATDHIQQQFLMEATEFTCERHPELAAKVYRVMLLRQLLVSCTHTCIINPCVVESSFLPDLHVIRRYVCDLVQERLEEEDLDDTNGTEDDKVGKSSSRTLTFGYLNEFLRNLLVDTLLFLTRAAIDSQDYTEAIRLLSSAMRESRYRKLETSYYYITRIVNNALVEGRSCELSDVRTSNAELQSLIAYRLREVVFDSREPFSNMHPHYVVQMGSTASRASQNEHDRFQAANTLCDFLNKRHSYGFAANLMFNAAERLRRVQSATSILNGESMVVQLMSHAVEAASNIPDVPSAPPLLETMYRTFSESQKEYVPRDNLAPTVSSGSQRNLKLSVNEINESEKALCLRLLVNPYSVVSEWPAFRSSVEPFSQSTKQDISLSRRDIPQLRFRHYQAHCERLLFQSHVSVDYVPWTIESAQLSGKGSMAISLSNVRNHTKDLLKKLLREGFTDEALQLAQLFVLCNGLMIDTATGGDNAFARENSFPGGKNDLTSFVIECRAATLASRDYAKDDNIAVEWALFVERDLIPASNLANGHLYLKRALTAALSVIPTHIPPVLIKALKERDLCGLLYCYLASGQIVCSGSSNGVFCSNDNTVCNPLVSEPSCKTHGIEKYITGNRCICDATLIECFTIGRHYIQAVCEIENSTNENLFTNKHSSFMKYDLPSSAFISDTVLERLEVLAKLVRHSETTIPSTCDRPTKNKKLVHDAAEAYLAAIRLFTKI